jgi:hypothetical protein
MDLDYCDYSDLPELIPFDDNQYLNSLDNENNKSSSSFVIVNDTTNDNTVKREHDRENNISNIETFKNRIVEFYFNLTRKNDPDKVLIKSISNDLSVLLKQIILEIKNTTDTMVITKCKEYLCILYKLIGQTRDIVNGKGERDLSYMMIYEWYKFYPVPAIYALRLFTQTIGSNRLFSSYGSWSDIKRFCNYVHEMEENKHNSDLIETVISIMNHQLYCDRKNFIDELDKYYKEKDHNPSTLNPKPNARDYLSLAAKWVPRENSKFGWVYEKMVIQWAKSFTPKILDTAITASQYSRAICKCKRNYRKMISLLNKELDTVQIKQCSHRWSEILPETVSITTLMKQKNAFSNINNNTRQEENDRIDCANNFQEFFNEYTAGENINESLSLKKNKTKTRLPLGYYVKQGLQLLSMEKTNIVKNQIQWLNNLWKQLVPSHYNNFMNKPNFIPIIDISWQLSYDVKNSGVGIGILLAQSCNIRRIMLTGNQPEWIYISSEDSFIDILEKIQYYTMHATNSFFNKTFDLICGTIIDTQMPYSEFDKLTFVLLSGNEPHSIYSELTTAFYKKINILPYVIYWNLSDTNNYKLDTQFDNNFTLVSGDYSSLIDYFLKFGVEGMKQNSTYEYIENILNHPRYKIMSNYLVEFLSV